MKRSNHTQRENRTAEAALRGFRQCIYQNLLRVIGVAGVSNTYPLMKGRLGRQSARGGQYPDYGYYDYSQPYASQTSYYCSDPAGYYPYVAQCNTGWQAVPAS